jgi:hypothetical protein
MKSSRMSGRRRFGTVLGVAVMTGIMALAVIGPPIAVGQATRTWVSGVGDDANPCSRTAPCKTFAGAISKTAASGEINCLDPGGFGGVTITKSLLINCEYTEGGVLVAGAGVNGIIVNAAATDVVTLRGLDIFGAGSAQNGVRFLAGAALHIEDSIITKFNAANGTGVTFAPSGASELTISNTIITDNGTSSSGQGILIRPTGVGSAKVTLTNVEIANNFDGLRAEAVAAGTKVSIMNSNSSENTQHGFAAIGTGGPVEMMIQDSMAAYNGSSGIIANTANATVRMTGTTSTGNGTGTNQSGGGLIQSYGDNNVRGNTSDGTRATITHE